MSCEPIRMEDGTIVLANMKEGETLTDEDKKGLEAYIQFCRDRRAKENAKGSQNNTPPPRSRVVERDARGRGGNPKRTRS